MLSRRRDGIHILNSLYWFTARAATFCFLLSLLVLALYLLGNFQEFMDATQVLLLTTLRLALWAEVLLSLLYIPVSVILGRQRVLRLLLCFLSVVYGLALLLATGFLYAWFQI